MSEFDKRVDAYIKKKAEFAQPILNEIRSRVHAGNKEISETIKWGMPFFIYDGKILCHMAAFKQHCTFGFWQSEHLPIETSDGAGSAMGQFGRLQSIKDLPGKREFQKLTKLAIELIDRDVPRSTSSNASTKKTLNIPRELTQALEKNKKALATFESFSYSNKKDYVEWVTSAKTEATRKRRILSAIEMLVDGKVRNWKYVR